MGKFGETVLIRDTLGQTSFQLVTRVNQHCFGPAERGLISGTTNDSQGLCSMGKGNSRIISLLYCSYT